MIIAKIQERQRMIVLEEVTKLYAVTWHKTVVCQEQLLKNLIHLQCSNWNLYALMSYKCRYNTDTCNSSQITVTGSELDFEQCAKKTPHLYSAKKKKLNKATTKKQCCDKVFEPKSSLSLTHTHKAGPLQKCFFLGTPDLHLFVLANQISERKNKWTGIPCQEIQCCAQRQFRHTETNTADAVPRMMRDRPDRYMFSMCRTVRWLPSLRARPKMGMERSFMSQFLKSSVVRHGVCNKTEDAQIASPGPGGLVFNAGLKWGVFLRDGSSVLAMAQCSQANVLELPNVYVP